MRYVYLLFLILSTSFMQTLAQEETVIVPDVTGLSVPVASVILNTAGLFLGEQLTQEWTLESGLPQNTISVQSIGAGSEVTPGTPVAVVVVHPTNMRIIYDDNDLTLLNMADSDANLQALSFVADNNASFSPSRLESDLRSGRCIQVWSIGRNGPKGLDECDFIQNWTSTSNTNDHFWTMTNGVQEFTVLENGISVARCPGAGMGTENNPLTCEFYFSGVAGEALLTEYLFFAYTTDAIALINTSQELWMLTDQTPIYNYNPMLGVQGVALRMGDEQVLREEFRRNAGDIRRLAPGQCLVLTTAPTDEDAPPQPCHVIAQRDLSPNVAFWLADFEIESVTSGRRFLCPGAIEERPTLCVIPR